MNAAAEISAVCCGDALVYCRVSTKGQEQDGTSLDSQEAACARHAQALGWRIGRVTREVYSGAELWDRPLLARDRSDIRKGLFQAVVVYSTDRLSRDPIHLAILAEEFARQQVDLMFVTEPLDNSDEGQLVRYVKGYSNKIEREKIRERSLRGNRERLLSGKIHSMGPELYGYRRNKEAGIRIIYEPEASIVRRVFLLVARDKFSFHAVARTLNDEQVPAPGNERATKHDPNKLALWNASTVMRMVRNATYKGEGYGWRYNRNSSKHRVMTSEVRIQRCKPPEEWIALPEGVNPPLVSPQLWQDAQAAVRAQQGDRTRNRSREYLLRGMIYCAVCGRRMWASWQRKTGGNPNSPKVRTYRCATHQLAIGTCGSGRVRADDIEQWVWAQIGEAMKHPERLAAELERRKAEGTDPSLTVDLEIAQREAARCAKQQERLAQRFSASEEESIWAVIAREIRRLEREKVRWEQVQNELEERIAEQAFASVQLETLHTYCAEVSNNLAAFDFEQRRLALEALSVRVRADGRNWTMHGSIPLDDVDVVASHIPSDWRRPSGW